MILGCMFRVGDALSTMAANSTTFPEVYNMGPDMRRLTAQQKWFAGARYSDHVAMFHAFQAWEEARTNGEWAEQAFCESKNLSMPTLRITWEAKVGGIAVALYFYYRIDVTLFIFLVTHRINYKRCCKAPAFPRRLCARPR